MNRVMTRTAYEVCPHCGGPVDALSGPRRPREGDVGVCFYCAGIVILDGSLHRRPATPAELEKALADPGVIRLVFEVRKHLLLHGGRP